MKHAFRIFTLIALIFSVELAVAQEQLKLNVGNEERTALIYLPTKKTESSPIIFAFHGHGGSGLQFHKQTNFEKLWPEAIVVYPQGLRTPGALTDPKGERAGWQNRVGLMDDRDLKFFDALLADLKGKYKVDRKRIYATGHSNGGGFTYLLLAERGDVFAAVAPSASVAGLKLTTIKSKPVLHIMGEKDPLVKPENQKRTIEGIKRINKVELQPEKKTEQISLYKSTIGNYPLETYIHSGGHEFVKDAAVEIVSFFKANARP